MVTEGDLQKKYTPRTPHSTLLQYQTQYSMLL
jgi:hypothetical protein